MKILNRLWIHVYFNSTWIDFTIQVPSLTDVESNNPSIKILLTLNKENFTQVFHEKQIHLPLMNFIVILVRILKCDT